MIYSRIAGTGGYLPERILTNADLEKQIETTDAWITERTGIKKRHIAADSDTSASMGAEAAKAALAMAGKSADEVDLIIVGTCTPDRIFPSTACLIQARLGIERSIPAFDVSAACSAFLYGLSIADQYIKTGVIRSALVIGSEVLSRVVNWQDRSTCILFGDGAGAVLLEASETPGILSTHLHARGQYQDLLYLANPRLAPIMPYGSEFVNMRGNEVFKIAVTELGNCVTQAIEANGLVKSDIDWLIPHQANVRIIQSLAKRLDLSFDKVVLTLADQGNTSAASIPLALDVAVRDGRIQRGQYLLFDAIGGGMAWGSALVVF